MTEHVHTTAWTQWRKEVTACSHYSMDPVEKGSDRACSHYSMDPVEKGSDRACSLYSMDPVGKVSDRACSHYSMDPVEKGSDSMFTLQHGPSGHQGSLRTDLFTHKICKRSDLTPNPKSISRMRHCQFHALPQALSQSGPKKLIYFSTEPSRF